MQDEYYLPKDQENQDNNVESLSLTIASEPDFSTGVKFDNLKVRMDLLPPDAVYEVAKIYTYGANKYEPRNWEKGMDWSRLYGAAQRHMTAFWAGEDDDPEWNVSHLAHAVFNMLGLLAYQLREAGNDDRYKLPPQKIEKVLHD